jgi:hypothetical protein
LTVIVTLYGALISTLLGSTGYPANYVRNATVTVLVSAYDIDHGSDADYRSDDEFSHL